MAEVLKALAGFAGRHAQDAGIQEALAQGYVNAIHSYGEAGHLDKALHLFQKLRDLNS
ncbi:MAG: hypothetical protein N3A60_12485 [Thermanaerothrix sp.]|nr:hypothetical protein [Thermanaerothrix sp.]